VDVGERPRGVGASVPIRLAFAVAQERLRLRSDRRIALNCRRRGTTARATW